MVVYGADVGALDALAVQVLTAAEQLEQLCSSVRTMLFTVPWHGNDAETFRAEWDGPLSARVATAVDALRSVADVLRKNATEQLNASSMDGSTALSSTLLQTLSHDLAETTEALLLLNPLAAAAFALTHPQDWPGAAWTDALSHIASLGGNAENFFKDLGKSTHGLDDLAMMGLGGVGWLISGGSDDGARGAVGVGMTLAGDGWGVGKDLGKFLANPASQEVDRLGGGLAVVGGTMALIHDAQTWSSDPHSDTYKGFNSAADTLTVVSGVAMMIPGGQGVAVAAEGVSLGIHAVEYLDDHKAGIMQGIDMGAKIETTAITDVGHAASHVLSWL